MADADCPAAIAHYKVVRKLGAGGMGEVFLANDTRLRRQVAIKFLKALPNSADTQQCILREARAAAALDHPHICAVFEVGEHEGRHFIVMQYVEGTTLDELLRRDGAITARRALEIGLDIADALHAAHAMGIVHRDIKPQNVMVMANGHIKLLDFGLARMTPMARPDDETIGDSESMSRERRIAGTPAYMAPEQIRGGRIDGRTDLYALGMVMYLCLTGRHPFILTPLSMLFEQICDRQPAPPSAVVAGLTRDHDALITRLTAKEPRERFDTAKDARDAIGTVLEKSRHESLGRRLARLARQPSAAVAAILLIVLVGIAAWYARVGRTTSVDVPEAAVRWYEEGADAVRQGSYTKAKRALQRAVELHRQFPLAHARLAEALSELDEVGAAKTAMISVHELVPDPGRLERLDRLRLAGINATVLRDFDKAVDAYAELAQISTERPDVHVDLGRALERVGKSDQALAEYRNALSLGPDSAVAHLRLAALLGEKGATANAQEQFAKAQDLYKTMGNLEGVVETLLTRGDWHNRHNRLAQARNDLTMASRLATDANLPHQKVRVMLQMSSVTASEGRFTEAESIASQAIDEARTAEMDGLAAWSLIDFGNVLLAKGQRAAAERYFVQAEEIATRHDAQRTQARAGLSRASVMVSTGRSHDAIPVIERCLAFYKQVGYDHNERLALTLLASAYANTGELERARATYEGLVARGRSSNDASATAVASERLSGVLIEMGRLPEALDFLKISLDTNRRVGNQMALPFNLAREAELLARLGRIPEAEQGLSSMLSAVERGDEAHVSRRAGIWLARARVESIKMDWRKAHAAALASAAATGKEDTSTLLFAEMSAALARAALGQRPRLQAGDVSALVTRAEALNNSRFLLTARELAATALMTAGEYVAAHQAAEAGIEQVQKSTNNEAAWRLHAIAAVSASSGHLPDAAAHQSAARAHLAAIEKAWGAKSYGSYVTRPDLATLKKRAGV